MNLACYDLISDWRIEPLHTHGQDEDSLPHSQGWSIL
jgi:hypothetical protein